FGQLHGVVHGCDVGSETKAYPLCPFGDGRRQNSGAARQSV
ncbi:uncharacterized protein METZ01_LOCUS373369, partial [marine metagenome]